MLTFLVIFAVITRCFGVEGVDECIGKCSQETENGIINYLPHNDCNKYCVCVAGQPEVLPCEPDQHWSPELEICTHPTEARCQGKSVALGCVSECPVYDILIGHHFCARYCECKNSQATVQACPAGFFFSTKLQTCVDWQDSDCPLSTKPPTNPPTEPPTRPPTERPTEPPIDANGCKGECPECNSPEFTVHLPHTDEHKFCKCNWKKTFVFQCPAGLVYIEAEQVCGYPEKKCN